LGEIQFEKKWRKKGERREAFIESLGGISIFLRFVENLWDVLGL
jgi:hypothetical protein